MAGKDPAMLLYTSDFLTGVSLLSMKERGQYITLICLQQQLGHMRRSDMERVAGKLSDRLLEKFRQDAEGRLYNPRAEAEILKRAAHCQKQSAKIEKRWRSTGSTGVLPLENEDADVNENENGDERDMMRTRGETEEQGKRETSSSALDCLRRHINPDPSSSCARAVEDYARELGQEVVCHAIGCAADDNKRTWSYVKAILQRYTAENIRSMEDVQRDEEKRHGRAKTTGEKKVLTIEDLERLEAMI